MGQGNGALDLFLALRTFGGLSFPHVGGHIDRGRFAGRRVEFDFNLIAGVALHDFHFQVIGVVVVDRGHPIAHFFQCGAIVGAIMPDAELFLDGVFFTGPCLAANTVTDIIRVRGERGRIGVAILRLLQRGTRCISLPYVGRDVDLF